MPDLLDLNGKFWAKPCRRADNDSTCAPNETRLAMNDISESENDLVFVERHLKTIEKGQLAEWTSSVPYHYSSIRASGFSKRGPVSSLLLSRGQIVSGSPQTAIGGHYLLNVGELQPRRNVVLGQYWLVQLLLLSFTRLGPLHNFPK